MKGTGGRPREYATHAERQAAYRGRKAEEGADIREALVGLRLALRRARRTGEPVVLDASLIDMEHEDSTMLHGLSYLIRGHTH
jgi:hypothetical protein